ncbi:MAG: hypothetical protein IJS60_02795 [Abditibacteriota bacterium]|nr:hypothetical protein [Abditibacteriota bacterium]
MDSKTNVFVKLAFAILAAIRFPKGTDLTVSDLFGSKVVELMGESIER